MTTLLTILDFILDLLTQGRWSKANGEHLAAYRPVFRGAKR